MSAFPRLGHIARRHSTLRTGLRWDALLTDGRRTLIGAGTESAGLASANTMVAGGELPPFPLPAQSSTTMPLESQQRGRTSATELWDNTIAFRHFMDRDSIAVDKILMEAQVNELEADVTKPESSILAAEQKMNTASNELERAAAAANVVALKSAKVQTLGALVEALQDTHPSAAADKSRKVIDMRQALEIAKIDAVVEKVGSAVRAARLKLLNVNPCLKEATKAVGEVTVQLRALKTAKLLRDTLLANLEVKKCTAALRVAEAIHDRVRASHANATPGFELDKIAALRFGLSPDVVAAASISFREQALKRAEEERDMLPFVLEVEFRSAVANVVKTACHNWPPSEADAFVIPYLHNLSKAEADRDLKRAKLCVASAEAKLDERRSGSFSARDFHSLYSALSMVKLDEYRARVTAAEAAYFCAGHDSPNDATAAYALTEYDQAMAESEVSKSEAAVAEARAEYLRANSGSSEVDADASTNVRLAKAKLEVKKCNAAVEAARVTFLRHNPGSPQADTDASAEVIAELRKLRQAKEHVLLLQPKLKVEECEAAIRLATSALGRLSPKSDEAIHFFFDVSWKLQKLAEAKETMNTVLAKRVVEKRKAELAAIRADSFDRVKREALAKLELLKAEAEMNMEPLKLKVEMFEAKLSYARIVYVGMDMDDVYSPVHSVEEQLEKAKLDRDSLAAQNEVRVCEVEVDIAEIDFRSKHPDKVLTKADVETSEEVSKKRMTLKQATYDAFMARVRLEESSQDEKFIVVSGLPPAIKLPHPPPMESRKSNAEALTILNKSFAGVELPSSLRSGLSLTWSWYASNYRNVPSIDYANSLVTSVMTEVCIMYDRYSLDSTRPLLDSTPDLSVCCTSPRIAIVAAINVANPCNKSPGDPFDSAAYQEMSKQLMTLRQDHGVSAPIGIISSYNEWQLCWHEFATPVAEATTIDAARAASVRAPTPADYRKLCVSEMYSCSDPRLVILLLSFVMKAYNAPLCDPSDTCWLHYSETEVRFASGGPKRSALKPDQMVLDDADNFYVVKRLSGGSSTVLQMAAESDACCAVKFPSAKLSLEERYALMESELGAWQKAYPLEKYPDVKVRVVTLNNSPALVMPFFEELSGNDWDRRSTKRIVKKHLEALALRGVFHQDIQRSHFMWAKGREDVRLVGCRPRSAVSGAPNSSEGDTFATDKNDVVAYVERSMRKLLFA